MSTDIPKVPESDYEELKCKYCLKVIGWGKCICDQWAKGLVETICAQCYIRKIVNQPK
jgi:hypothetical protein